MSWGEDVLVIAMCFHTHTHPYPKSQLVGHVQFTLHRLKGHPWLLGHQLQVHGLVGLQPDHQLIPSRLPMEDISWHVTELDPNLCLPLI